MVTSANVVVGVDRC